MRLLEKVRWNTLHNLRIRLAEFYCWFLLYHQDNPSLKMGVFIRKSLPLICLSVFKLSSGLQVIMGYAWVRDQGETLGLCNCETQKWQSVLVGLALCHTQVTSCSVSPFFRRLSLFPPLCPSQFPLRCCPSAYLRPEWQRCPAGEEGLWRLTDRPMMSTQREGEGLRSEVGLPRRGWVQSWKPETVGTC